MNEQTQIERPPNRQRNFLFYTIPKYGTSVMMGFADVALATLYILAYQIPPLMVGFALGMGKLMIAGSQFFLGWLSDAKYTRWGRRKPYMIILSPLLGISFILLLLPTLFLPLNDKTAIFTWLLIIYQFFNFAYGLTSVKGAWMAEQFRSVDRPKAAQFEQTFSFAGTATMAVFSLLILTRFIDQIQVNPSDIPPTFLYLVILFGILPVFFFYLSAFCMPTEPPYPITSTMVEALKTVIKNKNFLLVTLMIGIASLAWTQVSSLILLFTEVVLQLSETIYIVAAAIFILGILFFLYIWRILIRKFGKKKSLLYDLLVAAIFLPLTLLGLIENLPLVIYGILFLLGIAGILSGWYIFQSIMVPDISEDDEKATGELKAGTYIGFPSIPLNIFQAIGLIIMGGVLELPQITLRSSAFSIGYILWGPICSAILIVAYFFARKFIQLDFEWEKKS